MHSLRTAIYCVALLMFSSLAVGEDFEFKIPISQQNSGNYYVGGTLENDDRVEFLVDTGAGMVILTQKTFRSLSATAKLAPTRRIAARMADGRSKAVDVYTLEQLILGQDCNLGPLEVAVIPGAANNILGLNVLKKAAPFAIYTSPPSLALSACNAMEPNLANAENSEAESFFLQLANQISAD